MMIVEVVFVVFVGGDRGFLLVEGNPVLAAEDDEIILGGRDGNFL